MTPLTYDQVIAFLTILTLVMTVVLLYHFIAISLSVRRITRRADTVSRELEEVIMKPLSAADSAMDWIIGFLDGLREKKNAGKKHKSKAEEFEVVDL